MEMIHKQPVRWTHERVVACEGGGGPAGHPRIFINTDKPEISVCNYCGLPFVRHSRWQGASMTDTDYFEKGARAPPGAPRIPRRDVVPAVMMVGAKLWKRDGTAAGHAPVVLPGRGLRVAYAVGSYFRPRRME